MTQEMKFGIFTGPQNVSWADMREVWELAERVGFDSGCVWDHLLPLFGSLDQDQLEGWTVRSALPRCARRLGARLLVLANAFRVTYTAPDSEPETCYIPESRVMFWLPA